ncbi:MAG TPA: FtsQ-type POTRA domain-containing protein [Acidimicrobiia bacterium]|jgi:cell division protein FtsQ|nr:FtsQ-type POTRA domain-containing protein [Acidimicrobiia bacterium]
MTTVTAPRVGMDRRVRARRVAVQRAAGRQRLRRLLVVAGGLTVVLVAVAIVYSPLLAVHTVVVDGAGTEQTDVAQAAGVAGKPMVLLGAGGVAASVEQVPGVASATVTRHFPTTVVIHVTLEPTVGTVAAGPGKVALVDRDGQATAIVARAPAGLPVLAGAPATTVGSRVPVALARLAAVLPASLRARVSTLLSLPSGLTALVPGGPQLRFGDGTQLAAKAQAAAAVLGALVAPATYIDVSVPGAPVAG